MKYNIKQSSLLMLFALFLVAFCFIACDDQDNEEARYQARLALAKQRTLDAQTGEMQLAGGVPDVLP